MRQRAMIAIALSCDPEIILCDEPTTALDVTIQDQILPRDPALHNRGFRWCSSPATCRWWRRSASDIAVMYGGQLVERGEVRDVLLDPRHPYTLGLVRSAPDFEYVGSRWSIPGSPPSLINPPSGCRFHPRSRSWRTTAGPVRRRCGRCRAGGPLPACTTNARLEAVEQIGPGHDRGCERHERRRAGRAAALGPRRLRVVPGRLAGGRPVPRRGAPAPRGRRR